MTRDEAVARCIGFGYTRAECEAEAESNMVDGAYCDGTIVIEELGRRCVPREVVERKNDASDRDPLPLPLPSSSAAPCPGSAVLVGAIALGLVIVVVAIARR